MLDGSDDEDMVGGPAFGEPPEHEDTTSATITMALVAMILGTR
jgi:hypothetical protein